MESKITSWRQRLHRLRLEPGQIAELEQHLRDTVDELLIKGYDEERAFEEAVKRIGNPKTIAKQEWNVNGNNRSSAGISWMFGHTLRHLSKHKGYALLNITGLAVAFTACLFLISYLRFQTSFDDFVPDADRVYRVLSVDTQSGDRTSSTEPPMGPELQRDFTEVESAARIFSPEVLLASASLSEYENQGLLADPGIVSMLGWKVLEGNPQTMLSDPGKIVLTRSLAAKYLGAGPYLGKSLTIDHDKEVVVSGVIADIPQNSHLTASFLSPFPDSLYGRSTTQWRHLSAPRLYVKLRSDVDKADFDRRMEAWLKAKISADDEYAIAHSLQPVRDIYLDEAQTYTWVGDRQGRPEYLAIFSVVGLLLLASSGINYVNMASARAASRTREIGIRKSSGASSLAIALQIVQETVVLCLAAAAVALVTVVALTGAFNTISGMSFQIVDVVNAKTVALLLVLVMVLALMAGVYPAAMLAKLHPINAMKGTLRFGRGSVGLRRSLIVIQLAVTLFTVAGTMLVYRQWNHLRKHNLGITTHQIVRVALSDPKAANTYNPLKQTLSQRNDVTQIAGLSSALAGGQVVYYLDPEGMDERPPFVYQRYDPAFLDMMGLAVVKGEAPRLSSETADIPVLINETAARSLGWDEPLGKRISQFVVAGVVADFHFSSLKREIQPLVLRPSAGHLNNTYLNVETADLPRTLADIGAAFHAVAPDAPFVYHFVDDEYARMYAEEQRLVGVFALFAALLISVACLGLLGMTMFSAARQTKEIGIRKVMGAKTGDILVMQARQFVTTLLIGALAAVPAGWWVGSVWLEQFPYKVDSLWPSMALAVAFSALLLMATVAWHSWRIASANPVKALRSE